MNLKESAQVLFALKTAYPNSCYRTMSEQEILDSAKVWATMFNETEGSVVMAGVKAYILSDSKGFPPAIGQINHLIRKNEKGSGLSEMEAWALVRRAICNSGYESGKEFASLPPLVQLAVGSPSMLKSWAMMDSDEVDSVIASNFQRTFRAKVKNAEFENLLTSDVMEKLGIQKERKLLC